MVKNKSRPTLTSWHSISPILPRRWKSAIVLRQLSSTFQLPWCASNAKNMDTTGKPVEDNRHVPNAVKRTRTTWRKIAWKKLDVQTTVKIIRLTQDLAMFINERRKKKKEILGETQEECVHPGSKENYRELATSEKTVTPLLHRRQIKPITTTNIEYSWRNSSSWKPMRGQSFRNNWKTTLDRILPSTSNKLGMVRHPVL